MQQNTAKPLQPTATEKDTWIAHWQSLNQPWRTEPEIDAERQAYLAQRLTIQPDLEEGIYPFKDVRLDRADIEWLLAQHENGRGPVNWHDPQQHHRLGIDLRGANLRRVNLRGLPLSHMLGGLSWRERDRTPERREMAAVHLEGAILSEAHLEKAELYMAYLQKADFYMAHMAGASLRKAHLEGASLRKASLVYLADAEEARILKLVPADLRAAFFDNETDLRSVFLGDEQHGYVRLADVQWGGANLAMVDWTHIKMLGDEGKARKMKYEGEDARESYINDFREAVRANRQVSIGLQGHGLNEEATRFAYRAQLLQREVLRLQGRLGAYTFSTFLDLLAGYGYKPERSIRAYLLVIFTFSTIYFILGQISGPLFSPVSAIVFSLTSFHGRGFFPGGIPLDDPITVAASLEAVVGLTIEISFIATFTQRFFGK